MIETKLYGQFGLRQPIGHLDEFKNADVQVLLTLEPNPMDSSFKLSLVEAIEEYKTINGLTILHRNMTFGELVKTIEDGKNMTIAYQIRLTAISS